MEKPIIGIVAPRSVNVERPFKNYTKFVSNFPKRIIESGGIPIGLLFPDGRFNLEEANLCDGFLIQGGPDIESVGINIINYAIKNNKPVLGICLGMQTMAGYEWAINRLGDNPTYEMIDNFYDHKYEDEILKYCFGHNKCDPFYIDSINLSKHEVMLDKSSRIYKIYNKNKINVPSIHKQVVINGILDNGKYFKVTGKSDDVIEVIESIDPDLWIVGVQFHPELEHCNLKIFKELVLEAKRRK